MAMLVLGGLGLSSDLGLEDFKIPFSFLAFSISESNEYFPISMLLHSLEYDPHLIADVRMRLQKIVDSFFSVERNTG